MISMALGLDIRTDLSALDRVVFREPANPEEHNIGEIILTEFEWVSLGSPQRLMITLETLEILDV